MEKYPKWIEKKIKNIHSLQSEEHMFPHPCQRDAYIDISRTFKRIMKNNINYDIHEFYNFINQELTYLYYRILNHDISKKFRKTFFTSEYNLKGEVVGNDIKISGKSLFFFKKLHKCFQASHSSELSCESFRGL